MATIVRFYRFWCAVAAQEIFRAGVQSLGCICVGWPGVVPLPGKDGGTRVV